jgi:hypothetical protein
MYLGRQIPMIQKNLPQSVEQRMEAASLSKMLETINENTHSPVPQTTIISGHFRSYMDNV